jgi:hypothetical protein
MTGIMRKLIGGVVVGVVLTVVGCSSGDGPAIGIGSRDTTIFEEAAEAADSAFVEVLDDGRGLAITGESSDGGDGASIEQIALALIVVEMPESAISRMDRTRALDGTQDATWSASDGTRIRASWTYHPDAGLNIVLEEEP